MVETSVNKLATTSRHSIETNQLDKAKVKNKNYLQEAFLKYRKLKQVFLVFNF
jgi:hypothetical protein